MGFLPLQRSRRGESTTGFASPDPAASRVSHPPDGLILPAPSGLVACRWRSWGFALRRFSLPGIGRPYSRPSTGVPLARMALRFRSREASPGCPVFIPPEVRCPPSRGYRDRDPILPWVSSPPGLLIRRDGDRFRPPPSAGFVRVDHQGGRSVMPLEVSIASGPGSLRRVGRPS